MLGNIMIAPTMGKGLYDTETFGKADPYVVVTMGAHCGKTEVHKNGGVQPKWESKFTFPVKSFDDVLHFAVYDKEHVGKDDFMGEGTFSLKLVSSGVPKWAGDVPLTRKGKPSGCLQVNLEFLASSS